MRTDYLHTSDQNEVTISKYGAELVIREVLGSITGRRQRHMPGTHAAQVSEVDKLVSAWVGGEKSSYGRAWDDECCCYSAVPFIMMLLAYQLPNGLWSFRIVVAIEKLELRT
jgi:hypothetical protein